MSRQEDITRIIDALATRGIECGEGAAYYLRSKHDMLAVGAPIECMPSDEICSHLVGHGTHAKAPEWQELAEKMPDRNEPVLWTNGDLVDYGKGCNRWCCDAPATHWMRIPDLPKLEPKCKLCGNIRELHKTGVCAGCLDFGCSEKLVASGVISKSCNQKVYNVVYRKIRKKFDAFDTIDILLKMWEA